MTTKNDVERTKKKKKVKASTVTQGTSGSTKQKVKRIKKRKARSDDGDVVVRVARVDQEPRQKKQKQSEPEDDDSKKKAKALRRKWLQKDTENPYIKMSKDMLKTIDPTHQKIWIKYMRKDTKKQCAGGLLVRNEAPVYIKLNNPYAKAEFSVQVPNAIFYIRRTDHQALSS